jgi:hypothetical protein
MLAVDKLQKRVERTEKQHFDFIKNWNLPDFTSLWLSLACNLLKPARMLFKTVTKRNNGLHSRNEMKTLAQRFVLTA